MSPDEARWLLIQFLEPAEKRGIGTSGISGKMKLIAFIAVLFLLAG
jgi:hypothetical protein